jgi:hypothetical protein
MPLKYTELNIKEVGARGSVSASVVTLTTANTAYQLPSSPLTNRAYIVIYNPDTSVTVYLGPSGVTTSTGLPVPPQTYIALPIGSAAIYAVCGTASKTVNILEISAE